MTRGGAVPILLGAHVSTAGGVERAPGRGAELGADVIQIFTKPAQRWAEREIGPDTAEAFREGRARHAIRVAAAHDSYLINLASPDPDLHGRSYRAFTAELERCDALGLDYLVTHPGTATDGDHAAGLRRNAESIRRALSEVGGAVRVLIEGTAGQGNALGAGFQDLAAILEAADPGREDRLGVCLDTAHLFAAGYDLVDDFDGVLAEFDRAVGLERLRLLHLNDSRTPLGGRVDRHEHIARGHLGPKPFTRIMRDPRTRSLPKVIETPKEDDAIQADRRNLDWLRRRWAGGASGDDDGDRDRATPGGGHG